MRLTVRTGWLFVLGMVLPLTGRAQLTGYYDVAYRPPGVAYRVLRSEHFDVIYEERLVQEARETAAILEGDLPWVQALVGYRRGLRVPVVVNGFNDRSNGYVTPYPFKMELEAVGIKGNRLSARFPSWLWAVGPHELVHAVHADAGRGVGLGALLRPFAPDAVRANNLLLPSGAKEGVAVYHESRVKPGAGRLRYSLFQMQFRAAMLSDDPWSIAQMLEEPRYATPFDRYYIGGANLFSYLAAQDSARFFRRAVRLHYRWPYLGYGVELRAGTGQWPRRIARELRRDVRRRETARLASLGPLTSPFRIASHPRRSHRRPRWVNDTTLVAYVSGTDVRPGFYRFDARTRAATLLSVQQITEDAYFSVTRDSTALLFARYVQDPFSPLRAVGDVFRLHLMDGSVTRVSRGERTLAPVDSPGGVQGIRNEGTFTRWVLLDDSGRGVPVAFSARGTFLHLLPAPHGGPLAALMNVNGYQGIFRLRTADGAVHVTPWILFQDAAVLDATWSADGRFLLFTAATDGTANVFAFEPATDRVWQVTNVAFGAMEADLSPDGKTLAFVQYRHERYDLVRIPFDLRKATPVPRSETAYGGALPWAAWMLEEPTTAYDLHGVHAYQARAYLAPRMMYPILRYDLDEVGREGIRLGPGVGLALRGNDPLEYWAYGVEGFIQDERPWGLATVRAGRFVLRPALQVYDLPSTVVAQVQGSDTTTVQSIRVGRERRGVGLGVQLPVTLRANAYVTALRGALQVDAEQERFFSDEGATLLDFRSRVTLRPAAALAYRVQSNPRDLVPNTGIVLNVAALVDAWQDRGGARQALYADLTAYGSLSLRRHTSIQVRSGLLTQNRGSIYTLDRFLPRGFEDEFLGAGTFATLGGQLIQPLAFVEDGWVVLPVYVNAIYLYGFAETLVPLEGTPERTRYASVGAGVGIQFRFFYLLNFDLRVGAAFDVDERSWAWSLR